MKSRYLFTLFLIINVLFFSCGLDTFYSLEPPVRTKNAPSYDTELLYNYFHFYTNDAANKLMQGFKYRGTEVYYRIYANYQIIEEREDLILDLNNSTNYLAAIERLKSYKYQPLHTKEYGSDLSPLISVDNALNSQEIEIRLSKNPNYSQFSVPYIKKNGTVFATPVRCVDTTDGYLTFDFAETDESILNRIPSDGDEDYESGSFSGSYPNTYFVDLYAVAVGQDSTFTNYYSKVLHLGTVRISATDSSDN